MSDPIDFILDVHQKMHVGDINIAKALLISIGIQSVLNSDGIQPKLSGESGKGKTHCCKCMAHLIPKEYIITGNYSDKVIYYMAKEKLMKDGTVLFMDDVNLTDNMEAIIKKSTSAFQHGDTYISLNTSRKPQTMTTPKRIVWWLTSVDDNQSMQLLNRTFTVSVDVSKEQDQRVHQYQISHAESGSIELFESPEVNKCREILRDIKQHTFNVIVPFANKIKWDNVDNRRNFSILIDMIKAFAVLRYKDRQISSNNFLVAQKEDMDSALELYEPVKRNQQLKLTDMELKIYDVLRKTDVNNKIDAKLLQDAIGISKERLHQILHGILIRNKIGMLEKVDGIFTEKVSVKTTDYENNEMITQKRFYWMNNSGRLDEKGYAY
jgi:energy-coupling factor transporter ATP-binding protein EcfA2